MAIERITPAQARERSARGVPLIDIRDAHEREVAHATASRHVPMTALESSPISHVPDLHAPLMLICERGGRSLRAAQRLEAFGYTSVASVDGGTAAWVADGLPVERAEIDRDFHDRYSRHLRLPQVGLDGQRRLEAAHVAIVGAGGLGSPIAYYLGAAGVGTLTIADDDVVDRSNLQRQILHTDAAIGQPKVASARRAVEALNPRLRVHAFAERVAASNVERLVGEADVVVDGADNFAARYLLNDACVKLGKPLVYGAVHRFDGQASVFDAGRRRGDAPCYRCLFPEAPPPDAAPNCAEAGVLGVLPGVIGLVQATEAIKLLLGLGESLAGRLLHFDALAMRFRETRLRPDPDCAVCSPGREFPGYTDCETVCATPG
ncbi:molybdopterin-synthase adenylyltransferase MoeB [Cognatilysobacter bugurensis]|uniref:Molybdopterin-synthase adenylyltransferase n=1 Tax=Cognatilysobacter bugurensis TaxID=543356 RepID=A0A918SWV3_9GAMM|nr:molybdopterin-synthase adenylyltransferase MoeB [Lysobacter bugurensis]GHA74139.1 molybdopterin biosynthesis protein MoeB [Lysobacter bugurensis]